MVSLDPSFIPPPSPKVLSISPAQAQDILCSALNSAENERRIWKLMGFPLILALICIRFVSDHDRGVQIGPSSYSKIGLPSKPNACTGLALSLTNDPQNQRLTAPLTSQTASSSSCGRSLYSHSTFIGPNWSSPTYSSMGSTTTFRNKPHTSSGTPRATDGSKFGSFTLSPSPISGNRVPSIKTDMVNTPIEIIDDEAHNQRDQAHTRFNSTDRSHSLVSQRLQSHRQVFIDLKDEKGPTCSFGYGEGPSALARSLRRLPAYDDILIEIDCLEQYDVPGMREQDVYLEGESQSFRRCSPKGVRAPLRNPAIVAPLSAHDQYNHHGLQLRPHKTVELHDGDFLRIKDIIVNDRTKEVKLRGHRLQRVKDLNGMLEKKLNEVILFYEVDLDDPRDPSEQAAIEVSLAEIVRLRGVRFTNQKFPLCRNFNPTEFHNKEKAAHAGGLTARWKYTCTYASASDRYHNTYKERALERIKSEEAMAQFAVPEFTRKSAWRGETTPGGAYRPTVVDAEMDDWQQLIRDESPISITSSNPEPDDDSFIRVCSPESSIFAPEDDAPDFTIVGTALAKRKYSSESGPETKRIRSTNNDIVEETRRQLSRTSLQVEKSHSGAASIVIDLSDETPITCRTSAMPQTIDLLSSDLSTPPETGRIPSASPGLRASGTQLPGQMLTYGDAFCGAGGSTRGAAMAGLRVKWGFDFSEHACGTWQKNFPYAKCYQLAANDFVRVAKRAEARGFADIMKVDILHLSPPCQFFSPAHTVNGVDDEMNVASLFAVQSVIEVSKARVVTLEQTFGIACPRFRFYFNALIQMFTIHDFSVRWSIIPLAQWVRNFCPMPPMRS
jgi:DNA (cytosine-5)-methyltransferase 1